MYTLEFSESQGVFHIKYPDEVYNPDTDYVKLYQSDNLDSLDLIIKIVYSIYEYPTISQIELVIDGLIKSSRI